MIATSPAGRPQAPAPNRAKLRLRRLTPLMVWIGVLLMTGALYARQNGGITVTGYAEEVRYRVACETTGRLQRVEVQLNQDVYRGQIVASFEQEELLLQLQEARTELDRMAHDLGRERALLELDAGGQQIDQQTTLRRFARDASNDHIEYLTALAELAEDQITLQGLELTLNRTRGLEEKSLAPAAELDKDRIAFEALEAKIVKQETTVATLLTAYEDAKARYLEFLDEYVMHAPDAELLLKPLESGIEVQKIRIEMANLAISRRVLRAPADGRVEEIFSRAGEVVAAGQPVLSILEPQSTTLVAYVPESRILDISPGDEVRVRRVADPRRTFVGTVSGVGTSVRQVPLRLDPVGQTPTWGIAFLIPMPASLAATPGEAFEISF